MWRGEKGHFKEEGRLNTDEKEAAEREAKSTGEKGIVDGLLEDLANVQRCGL